MWIGASGPVVAGHDSVNGPQLHVSQYAKCMHTVCRLNRKTLICCLVSITVSGGILSCMTRLVHSLITIHRVIINSHMHS